MTEFNRALVDIRSIRRQVAQQTEFRGYGPATLFATAVLSVLAGLLQARWIPDPEAHASQYAGLWLSTGLVCGALILTQALTRASRLHSGMADEMLRLAVTQFLPAAVAGLAIPFVLLHAGTAVFWMLPGLWQIVFSLGVFASSRSLPRPMLLVGVWFLFTGFLCLLSGSARSLAPTGMAVAFAIGMAAVGTIHLRYARTGGHPEDEDL